MLPIGERKVRWKRLKCPASIQHQPPDIWVELFSVITCKAGGRSISSDIVQNLLVHREKKKKQFYYSFQIFYRDSILKCLKLKWNVPITPSVGMSQRGELRHNQPQLSDRWVRPTWTSQPTCLQLHEGAQADQQRNQPTNPEKSQEIINYFNSFNFEVLCYTAIVNGSISKCIHVKHLLNRN
jgi:hypothetical protein